MKKLLIPLAVTAAAACALPSCSNAGAEHLKSLNKAYIDTTISAKDDFYNHVTKGWQKAHPLTGEYSRFGAFDLLRDTAEMRVKDIVTGMAATNPAEGTNEYKIATLYTQGMDSTTRNAQGAEPIKPYLAKIEETPHEGMNDLFLWMHSDWGNPFFDASMEEDWQDSKKYTLFLSAGGLTLGDRDYYLENDERNTAVRNAYRTLVETQMQNAGYSEADAKRIADNVLKIETAIAKDTWTREEMRNLPAMYNPRTLAQVQELYPNVDWKNYFKTTMKIDNPDTIVVAHLETLGTATKLMNSLDDRAIKDYYLWYFVDGAAGQLSDNFTDAEFEFNKVMSGVQEQKPRWKRALAAAEGSMGEAVGQIYVERYFPESSKKYMIELVGNLQTALGQHIDSLTWMSDETKARAHEKLNQFTVKIGYPDKWKDYSTMAISGDKSYFENMHAVGLWHRDQKLAKWGKPVDKDEWLMTPQTVNAYYNPTANEIVFPAGILQAPFFDPEASDAENYGGIGVVIGHEMTHGFDDQGRNFDANGNMVDWWTPADTDAFNALAAQLGAQFDAVEVLPGLFANGSYTMGENIADQGGLRVARTAFLASQDKKGVDVNSEKAMIDGFMPMQVFYLNYANLWAQNIRDNEIRRLTAGDVHSLGINRVNVTLRNLDPFFEAFGIVEGDGMFRPEAERVVIW